MAGNTHGDLTGGAFSGTYNLIGTGGLSTGSSSHNIQGTSSSPVDADLTSLGNFGGPTQTIALLSTSSALGAGSAEDGVTSDQRGFSRPSGSVYDIGAFQTQSDPLVVNTTSDDPIGPGKLSLRDAINLGDALGGDQTITFASGLTGTINLNSSGTLILDDPSGTLTIDGPGAGVLSVDSGGHGGVFFNYGTAEIEGLAITGGSFTGGYEHGGGIDNLGILTINESTITDNSAEYGGGIANDGGTLTITNSTISGNSCDVFGGGVYNSGTLNISDSTLSGNTAGTAGGGIGNYGNTATIENSTITGNTSQAGGGVWNYDGNSASVYLTDSTVVSNTATHTGEGGGIGGDGTLYDDVSGVG